MICHGGDGTHFTAFIGAHPDERVGVALLMNMGRTQTARSVIGRGALRALLDEPVTLGPGAVPPPGADGEWDRAVGSYVSTFWSVEATLTIDGGVPWVRVNLERHGNPVNARYDVSHEPAYLPGLLADQPWDVHAIQGKFHFAID